MTRPSRIATHVAVIAFVCLLAGGGCASRPSEPGQLGEPFDLRAGAPAAVQGGLTILFDRVSSDSRCPIDANCVWAGDAVVVLKLSHRSGSRADADLHTDRRAPSATFMTYTIELVALAPSPHGNRPIEQSDYVATLTVSSR
jgi:hypothetical protein